MKHGSDKSTNESTELQNMVVDNEADTTCSLLGTFMSFVTTDS